MEIEAADDLPRELNTLQLGDLRLEKRCVKIASDMATAPRETIPSFTRGDCHQVKAVYRFCDNENVSEQDIFRAHEDQVKKRLDPLDEVLLIGDTTTLTYPNIEPLELGEVGSDNYDGGGMMVHTTLAVAPRSGFIKGVVDQQKILRRSDGTKLFRWDNSKQVEVENEHKKWDFSVEETVDKLPEKLDKTYVFDRGGDSYDVIKNIKENQEGFVIRANQNRTIRTAEGERDRLREWITDQPVAGEVTRTLYTEKGQKEVTFTVQYGRCRILAPHPQRVQMEDQGARLVNVVRVMEKNPDDEKNRIEWILLTDRDLQSLQEAKEVIKRYEWRWRIEDFHEALKTRGTDVENREFETFERICRFLALASVVAVRLVGLRQMARAEGSHDPGDILTEAEMRVIEQKDNKTSRGDEAKEYLLGVARIGGYLDRNNDPPPGWEILWRGMKKVQTMAKGFELAQ